MQQVRHLVLTVSAGTLFYHPLTPTQRSGGTVASSATIQMPAAGTIRKLAVVLSGTPTTSGTFRFNVGGSASALSVTIVNGATAGQNATDALTLAAGDTLVFSKLGTTGTLVAFVSFEWEPDDGVTSIYGFGGQNDTLGTSTHRDGLLDGGGNDWDSTADAIKTLVGIDGDVTTWRMVLSDAPGVGNSRTFTIYLDGVAQDGSGATIDTRITIADAATSGSASFTLPFTSGQYEWVETSHTGTPTAARASGSVGVVATVAGRWHVGVVALSPTNDTDTLYVSPSGRSDGTSTTWDTTEANRQHLAGLTPYYLGGMIGRLITAPGGSDAVVYTLRVDGAATAQTLTFTGASLSEATAGAAVLLAHPSTLALQYVPVSTPTVLASSPKFAWWASSTPPDDRVDWMPGTRIAGVVKRYQAIPSGFTPPGHAE